MAKNPHGQSITGPLIFSLIFHLAVFYAATVGVPFLRPKVPVIQDAVSVEFIQVEEKEQKKKKPKPKKNNKPKSAPKNTAEKPPVLKKPEKPIEKPKVAEKPVPKKPLTKPKPVKKPDTKPKPKKKEQPKEEVQQNEFSSLLKNLQDSENLRKQEEETPDKPEPKDEIKSLADSLTSNELSIVSSQIGGCWYVPSGAKDAQDLIVDVRIYMNPDRTVRAAQIVDEGRYRRDSFFRAAAESALRAIRNPACTPLKLPPNKFDQWKSFVFRFDPSEML